MKETRLAVIDLGSNTFHLLIAETDHQGQWNAIWKDRRYVKLASGGIDIISDESIERAILVMKAFSAMIQSFDVSITRAIGTAALREAKNGMQVAQLLEETSGVLIEIIDGHKEAAYILKGIQSALPPQDRPCLIMDIGGGSVEFILYDQQAILFAQSFKIGVAVLHQLFHRSDPISDTELLEMDSHFQLILRPLLEVLSNNTPYYLIGASGSFEVIQDKMEKIEIAEHWSELGMKGLVAYLNEVIGNDIASRKLRHEIPVERLDYIVVAYALIRFILRQVPPEKLLYCEYALKEGVIVESLQDLYF